MARSYEAALSLLDPHHVQLVWPRKAHADFVFGDMPLVHSRKDGRISALDGLALGDADQMFLPVGPRLLALFTHEPMNDGSIDTSQVQMLNRKTWKAALRFVGANPDTNAKRSAPRVGLVDH